MQRTAFLMQIKLGSEAEYQRRHQQIWLEMLAELKAVGRHTYSIFRAGLHLFVYLEVEDLDRYRTYLAESAVAARWETYMSDILLRTLDPGTSFPPLLTEVFHLEEAEETL